VEGDACHIAECRTEVKVEQDENRRRKMRKHLPAVFGFQNTCFRNNFQNLIDFG